MTGFAKLFATFAALSAIISGCAATEPQVRTIPATAMNPGPWEQAPGATTGPNVTCRLPDYETAPDYPAYVEESPIPAPNPTRFKTPDSLGEGVVATARSQLGVPYRWGGTSPRTGFDCSGFARWVYARHGVHLPRTTREQRRQGRAAPQEELEPGDLLIYKRSSRGRSLHVGIYVGGGKFIHSPNRGSHVREEAMDVPHWRRLFIEARKVIAEE